ncbi:MAG TPA: DNA-3-methyladenine glycosylase 2 family protein [Firmicutes bacterium]|nr:DNA-3-methyladenine glycosylase 2 family protein [Bacillota bacterium]
MYFQYGETELEYLKKRDARMRELIEKVGYIQRRVDCELFPSVVHQIVGQQISTKAMETIWSRINSALGVIDAETILSAGADYLQALGISYRKADYIIQFARKVSDGELELESLWTKSDDEVIKELSALKGVGEWTAEMILLFCMQRPNVFSYNDLAIQRGLRMVYHHRSISRELFEKYRRRFSPYCSVASLYLWAAAGGAVEGLKDYAPKKHKLISAK